MNQHSLNQLLSPDFMVKQILAVHKGIYRHIQQLPVQSFDPYFFRTAHGLKQLANIDLIAEMAFISTVTTKFGHENIRIIGEESLSQSINLENETRTCVLIDMIDGTDLLQRNFGNWCSAIVVFNPQDKDILGAFVAVPSSSLHNGGYLYYATKSSGAYRIPLRVKQDRDPTPLKCDVEGKTLRDASVCMYSQKNTNFECLLSLSKKRGLTTWIKENKRINKKKGSRPDGKGELNFRFYNFAGNPMMVRMGDGTVDVVFDLIGQAPHDVVPGAFIATKAGAVMGNLDGRIVSSKDLASTLIRPAESPLSYVLAASREMFEDMINILS